MFSSFEVSTLFDNRIFDAHQEYAMQGLVKGAELYLNPYFFGWLEK